MVIGLFCEVQCDCCMLDGLETGAGEHTGGSRVNFGEVEPKLRRGSWKVRRSGLTEEGTDPRSLGLIQYK